MNTKTPSEVAQLAKNRLDSLEPGPAAPVAGHTPGEWSSTDEPFRILKGDIPLLFIGIGNGVEHIGYASVTGCVPVEQALANARLMASAPTLLRQVEQLRAALEIFAKCDLNDDNCASLAVATRRIRNMANAALAAAQPEGKP